MRYLSWIITVPIVVVAVAFTLSNRGTVEIALWPLAARLGMPVFLAVLAPFVIGFLLGGLVAWISGARDRRAAARLARRTEQLSEDLRRLSAERTATDRHSRVAAEVSRIESASRAARAGALLDRPAGGGPGQRPLIRGDEPSAQRRAG